MSLTEQILSGMAGNPLMGLRQADRLWQTYREGPLPTVEVVVESDEPLETVEWDVVICGGTLGILIGCTLAQRGWRVAVLEKGLLRGREQEWNISRRELQSLVDLDVLTEAELAEAIATTYNPARVALHPGFEVWVEDVLNIGVDPVTLLDRLKARFLAAGGQVFEQTGFERATVHPNGVHIQAGQVFHGRLLIDAMGHFSPITRQARGGQPPDAVCLVVGTCATGFPDCKTGDLFASMTPIQNQCQYFWEAFPARDGRTTYLFTYVDAHRDRPSLEQLFDDYFRLLPDYQAVSLDSLSFVRALFGFFPCYRQSPLRPRWPRVLAVGDSSGSQSPLSFGGFGAMIRHLKRLTLGIHDALQTNGLHRAQLALLQPYQPGLSVTWLFQKSMSVGVDQTLPPHQINALLAAVFGEMDALGDRVLKPFLQDVVQFPALFQTLTRVSLRHPGLVLKILPQVGLPTIMGWLVHYVNLGLYAGLDALGRSLLMPNHDLAPWVKALPPMSQYYVRRWLDAWHYGSGGDYADEGDASSQPVLPSTGPTSLG